jgi:PAS domain S-box-containing protein
MKPKQSPTAAAGKIAVIYALVSAFWILSSDQLLAATATTVETVTRLQMMKGWAFVLTTSVLIFWLMRQEMNRFFKADESQRAIEAALSESEARLRLALESAQMSIWEHDLKTHRFAWEGTHRELFGLGPEQLNGAAEALYDFVHPEDRASLLETSRQAIESHNPFVVEFRIVKPNGELRWIGSRGRVICDQDNRPARTLGVVWDISERKDAQRQLEEATQRLDFLVTESPAVVFTYDLRPEPHGNYISRNLETILGWRPEQFSGNFEFWKKCVHPADLPPILEGLGRLQATGKHVFEYRFKDATGRYRWLHDEQRIVADGERKQVVGAWWDVTEVKSAQEELKRLAAAIEQAAEIVVITDEKANIVYTNPAFERITGYERSEVIGKNPRILKSGELGQDFYQKMWALLSAGETWHGSFVNRKKNGALYTEEATISPVFDSTGAIVNYVAVKRDITKEQELEQQFLEAQKMEAIGTLAGGIAHDFNNLLAVILANTELLQLSDGQFSSETKETLGQIMQASKRAKELVRQILQFSRRGRQEKIIMSLKPMVKETMGLLRASLPAIVQFELQITGDVGMVLADPSQMQQVLMNLGTNAAHAMEGKGGVLKITLSNGYLDNGERPAGLESSSTEYVKLTVSDTGHGMQPWVTKKIFEPYFTTKERGKGTGLGLSVVHGIVKSHDGDIRVSSVLGKGSIFEVYLPRAKYEETESVNPDMPIIKGTGRLLFVDDEASLTLVGQKMLSQLGYQVKATTDPAEALQMFRSTPDQFDLVITDLAMPGITGLELASSILEIRPSLPILLCTGFSDWVKEEMLQSMGIRGLLIKPVTIHELAHVVKMAITTPDGR